MLIEIKFEINRNIQKFFCDPRFIFNSSKSIRSSNLILAHFTILVHTVFSAGKLEIQLDLLTFYIMDSFKSRMRMNEGKE
jgi:hypothetical protein